MSVDARGEVLQEVHEDSGVARGGGPPRVTPWSGTILWCESITPLICGKDLVFFCLVSDLIWTKNPPILRRRSFFLVFTYFWTEKRWHHVIQPRVPRVPPSLATHVPPSLATRVPPSLIQPRVPPSLATPLHEDTFWSPWPWPRSLSPWPRSLLVVENVLSAAPEQHYFLIRLKGRKIFRYRGLLRDDLFF